MPVASIHFNRIVLIVYLEVDFACLFEVWNLFLPLSLFLFQFVDDGFIYEFFGASWSVSVPFARLLDVIHGLVPLFQVSEYLDRFVQFAHLFLDLSWFIEVAVDGTHFSIDFLNVYIFVIFVLVY